MAERMIFLAAVVLLGSGVGLWVHAGAGLAVAGLAVLVDAWMPSRPRGA